MYCKTWKLSQCLLELILQVSLLLVPLQHPLKGFLCPYFPKKKSKSQLRLCPAGHWVSLISCTAHRHLLYLGSVPRYFVKYTTMYIEQLDLMILLLFKVTLIHYLIPMEQNLMKVLFFLMTRWTKEVGHANWVALPTGKFVGCFLALTSTLPKDSLLVTYSTNAYHQSLAFHRCFATRKC